MRDEDRRGVRGAVRACRTASSARPRFRLRPRARSRGCSRGARLGMGALGSGEDDGQPSWLPVPRRPDQKPPPEASACRAFEVPAESRAGWVEPGLPAALRALTSTSAWWSCSCTVSTGPTVRWPRCSTSHLFRSDRSRAWAEPPARPARGPRRCPVSAHRATAAATHRCFASALRGNCFVRSFVDNYKYGIPEGGTMARGRSVSRSAATGRFVSRSAAARWPGRTTTERVGRGTGNSTTVNRSASTGRFITTITAKRHPESTVRQRV